GVDEGEIAAAPILPVEDRSGDRRIVRRRPSLCGALGFAVASAFDAHIRRLEGEATDLLAVDLDDTRRRGGRYLVQPILARDDERPIDAESRERASDRAEEMRVCDAD